MTVSSDLLQMLLIVKQDVTGCRSTHVHGFRSTSPRAGNVERWAAKPWDGG